MQVQNILFDISVLVFDNKRIILVIKIGNSLILFTKDITKLYCRAIVVFFYTMIPYSLIMYIRTNDFHLPLNAINNNWFLSKLMYNTWKSTFIIYNVNNSGGSNTIMLILDWQESVHVIFAFLCTPGFPTTYHIIYTAIYLRISYL